jgi:hypothetical protein
MGCGVVMVFGQKHTPTPCVVRRLVPSSTQVATALLAGKALLLPPITPLAAPFIPLHFIHYALTASKDFDNG